MKPAFAASLLFFLSTLLTGCGADASAHKAKYPPETVADLAYSEDNRTSSRIYLKENGVETAFLVLDADYGGSCLLLREALTDDPQPYNTPQDCSSYYSGSTIDRYLNETYFPLLSETVQAQIPETAIPITTKHAINTHANETENILRKVFLLSAYEVDTPAGASFIREGEPLQYFRTNSRIASRSDGSAGSWMLRTAALQERNNVFGVSEAGIAGIGGINGSSGPYQNGVRPAFCLPRDLPVSPCTISGKQEFCLSQDS